MKDEQIIRNEAKNFFSQSIEYSDNEKPIEQIRELKNRLQDFYSLENKSIFLDEVEINIKSRLETHRKNHHGGNPSENCDYEKSTETLLYYIRQELSTFPTIAHQTFKSNPHQPRNKVFISYSHYDKDFVVDIKRHFKPFLDKIDYWDDTKIQPGQKWKEEIVKAISQTKVAILLVSTDFLGSEFIRTDEIPPLLKAAEENGAVILIVILKPCLFEEFSQLNIYQALNSPTKPVIKMDEIEKEEFFVNLTRQTKKIIENE